MAFNPFDSSINKGQLNTIGKPGYDRALAAGYTPEEINQELMKAQNDGTITVGPNSGYVKPTFNATDPTYNKGRTGVFGGTAYTAATNAGFSDAEIQAGIDEAGLYRARNVPGYVKPPRPELDATNSRINRGRVDIWGAPATAIAQKRGYSTDEINAAIDAAGIKTSKKANAALGRTNPKSELFDKMLQNF